MTDGSFDTNALLRLLLNDIPDQHRAVKRLLTQAKGQFAVADTAIIELVFVLLRHYGLNRSQILQAITGLIQLREINCNRTLFERALPTFVDRPALSFEDCCLAAYAELNDATPLWTFDKKLAGQSINAKLIRV